eukprot:365914-Chlamydomonas_euryale.AAC.5
MAIRARMDNPGVDRGSVGCCEISRLETRSGLGRLHMVIGDESRQWDNWPEAAAGGVYRCQPVRPKFGGSCR